MSDKCFSYSPSINGQCLVDQTIRNRERVSINLPLVHDDGSYTLNQIDAWAEDFIQSYSSEATENPLVRAEARFGPSLYITLNSVNQLLNSANLVKYPDLSERINRGNVGALEFVDFMEETNYTPPVIDGQLTLGTDNLLFQLDGYYKNTFSNSILGGFCKQIEGVFGAIDAFFDIVDTIQGFISDALSFITRIKNNSFFKDVKEKGLAEALIKVIKRKIIDVIEQTWRKVAETIRNFNLLNYVNCAENFINENIAKRGRQIQDDAEAIMNDDNKETLKDRIEKLFDYAVSLFDRKGLAEIQYLVLRFCSFISNIEALINEVKRPSQNFALKYEQIVNRLGRASNSASALFVKRGAKRYPTAVRKQNAEILKEKWSAGVTAAETGDESENSYPTPSGKKPKSPPAVTCKEINNIPTFKVIESGGSNIFAFPNGKEGFCDGESAWKEMDCNFVVKIMRVQAVIGKTFNITSAWRSSQCNKNVGGVEGSWHMAKKAFDISTNNLNSDDIILMRSLLALYNLELIAYSSHIHIEPAGSGNE